MERLQSELELTPIHILQVTHITAEHLSLSLITDQVEWLKCLQLGFESPAAQCGRNVSEKKLQH